MTRTISDVNILDDALTAAEEHLGKLLPKWTPEQIRADFEQHIITHLETELDNIRSHGHRNDDPTDVPEVAS